MMQADASTDFSSLNLEKLYPFDELERLCNKAEVHYRDILVPRGTDGCMARAYNGLLELYEQTFFDGQPDYRRFIERVGFLGTNDLYESALEDEQVVKQRVIGLKSFFPTWKSVRQEQDKIKHDSIMMRIKHAYAIQGLLSGLSGDELSHAETMVEFAIKAATHNELRREYIMRTYRVFRRYLQHYGLDLQETSLDELRSAN